MRVATPVVVELQYEQLEALDISKHPWSSNDLEHAQWNPNVQPQHNSFALYFSMQPPTTMMRVTLLILLVSVSAFLPSHTSRLRARSLFGIAEWRDLVFDFPGTGDDRRLGMEQGPPPKEVCILPFPYTEVLLQGETKQLRLYEERCV